MASTKSVRDCEKLIDTIKQLLKQKDVLGAAKKYSELRELYTEVVKSDTSVKEKKSLYKKINDLYVLLKKADTKSDTKTNVESGSETTKNQESAPKSKYKDNILLSEAISDIDREVNSVVDEKARLEKEMSSVIKAIATVQNDERGLRDQISKLVEKEGDLNTRRLGIKERITKCQDKTAEMLKIKEELRTV